MEYRIFRATGIAFLKAMKTDYKLVKVDVPNVNANIVVYRMKNGDLDYATLYIRGGYYTLHFSEYKKFQIVRSFAAVITSIVTM